MSKTNSKRALVAPQAVTAADALAFQAAMADLDRANAIAEAATYDGLTDDEQEANSNRWGSACDHIISTPAPDLASVASKVEVLAHYLIDAGKLFRRPADQKAVAESDDDMAKGLLAIYLDLNAIMNSASVQASVDRAKWDAALAEYAAAKAELEAVYEEEAVYTDDDVEAGDLSDRWNAADNRLHDALIALLNVRAPDAAAMGTKARLILDRSLCEYVGDTPDNPATIARILAGPWEESAVAALYQDSLALSGATGGAVDAVPDPFDPQAWHEQWSSQHGVEWFAYNLTAMYPDYRVIGLGPDADVAAAEAAFEALAPWHKEAVADWRDKRRASAEAVQPLPIQAAAASTEGGDEEDEDDVSVLAGQFDSMDMPLWTGSEADLPVDADGPAYLFYASLARATLTKTKPELLALVDKLDNGEPWGPNDGDSNPLGAYLAGLSTVEKRSEAVKIMAGVAMARVIAAIAKRAAERAE